MGGRGGNSRITRKSKTGVNSHDFFSRRMTEQMNDFIPVVNAYDANLFSALSMYAVGAAVSDDPTAKGSWDDENGVSAFIDSKASDPIRLNNSPVLYRGGTITDAEFQALRPGQSLDILSSKDQLTSWSDREMVAHMYAEDTKQLWGGRGDNSHDVIIVDTSNTNDGVVLPFTYPHNEVLRSKNISYTITRIVDASEYTAPMGRDAYNDNKKTYSEPVTYIFVKSVRKN